MRYRFFDEWLLAAVIIVATGAAAAGIRYLLRLLSKQPRLAFVAELAPALSNIAYLVGLALVADVAPMPPKLSFWLDHAIYIFGVFVVLSLVRRVALIGLEWNGWSSNQSAVLQQGFIPLIRNLITLFVFLAGAIMILKHFNYDVLSLLTALGVGSLAVGLAAQPTLSNMISGFTLIIDRNLRPGERIRLNEFTGEVEEIGLRSTRIRLGNGNVLIVPNSELVNTKLVNLSQPTRAIACTSTFKVPSGVPFSKVREIALAAMGDVPTISTSRARSVILNSLSDGNQAVSASFWVDDLDSEGGSLSAFNERLVLRLGEEKIPLRGAPSAVS